MRQELTPAGFTFATVILMLSFLAAGVAAPHDKYYRWQQLDSGTTRKADWIYERLHFDPEPIDVALIGTSRTGGGVSGPDIEAAYCAATGRAIRVANLALPETGRNMHYVIAKEAMRAKAPALTIIELNESEARLQHRGFVVLADVQDVLSAPIAVNVNYFSDLVRLPGRQAALFLDTSLRRGAVRPAFEPARYLGHDIDRTRALTLLDGSVTSKFTSADRAALDAAYAERRAAPLDDSSLPPPLRRLALRVPRLYLAKIEEIVNAHGGDLDYMFMPAWREGVLSPELLNDLGVGRSVIDLGGAIAGDSGKWIDATHLNAWGAMEVSAQLAAEIARRHPELGRPGCARA